MANYPQLDDCSGVWTLKEVNNAVMGGYWRNHGSRGIFGGGYATSPSASRNIIDYILQNINLNLIPISFNSFKCLVVSVHV